MNECILNKNVELAYIMVRLNTTHRTFEILYEATASSIIGRNSTICADL